MRIFKTRLFAKFARRERIPDASLREAIERAGRALIDADLGGGVIKQRVGRKGQGRSRGYRTLIAYRFGEFAVFLFGFAKSDRVVCPTGKRWSVAGRLQQDCKGLWGRNPHRGER